MEFSANPATAPRMLIWLAVPLWPPSVGSAVIVPCCHRNGRHVVPEEGSPSALKPQKSSPFGSKADVSASPTAWPIPLAPNAMLFGPPSPRVAMSIFSFLYQRTACIAPVWDGRDTAYQAIVGYQERLARRPAHRAEVGNGIAWWLCHCECGEQGARGNRNHNRFHMFSSQSCAGCAYSDRRRVRRQTITPREIGRASCRERV